MYFNLPSKSTLRAIFVLACIGIASLSIGAISLIVPLIVWIFKHVVIV
jgi:hypothetical protein